MGCKIWKLSSQTGDKNTIIFNDSTHDTGIQLTGCIVFQQKARGRILRPCAFILPFPPCKTRPFSLHLLHGYNLRRVRRFRPFPPWFCAGRENPQKKPWKRSVFKALWRRRWDSNPRALADYLISSQARYDHFDTSPQMIWFWARLTMPLLVSLFIQ